MSKKKIYEAPAIEVIDMELEGAILTGSTTVRSMSRGVSL